MAVWPATLPCLAFDTTDARQDGSIRTEMGTGPAKVRRRFSAVSRYATAILALDATQRATLDAFYATTLAEGSLAFDVADPYDGTTVSARFTSPISYQNRGKNGALARWFLASVNVEILP